VPLYGNFRARSMATEQSHESKSSPRYD
jgi:hypothetical protein